DRRRPTWSRRLASAQPLHNAGELRQEVGGEHARLTHRGFEVHPGEAVQVHAGDGCLEGRQLLAHEPGDHAGKDVAGSTRCERRRGDGVEGHTAIRGRVDASRPSPGPITPASAPAKPRRIPLSDACPTTPGETSGTGPTMTSVHLSARMG